MRAAFEHENLNVNVEILSKYNLPHTKAFTTILITSAAKQTTDCTNVRSGILNKNYLLRGFKEVKWGNNVHKVWMREARMNFAYSFLKNGII